MKIELQGNEELLKVPKTAFLYPFHGIQISV